MKPLAEDDPAVFIRACLTDASGDPLAIAPVHERLQQFLTDHPRALVELPRDHGKSVQVCGRILWELGRNPALRVKVVCATDAIAAERGRFIRDAIAKNPRVGFVFPHLTPAAPWAADAFTVERPAEVIGPSVAAFGIGTGSTGTRADLLVCDDVVDVKSLHSRRERDRAAAYFHDNLMNLLEPDGRFWGLFTPWHLDDLNARLKRNPAYAHFREAVGADFEPVWEAKWPAERLRARKEEIGSASFARGYQLRPVSDEDTAIRPEWVRFWEESAECDEIVLAVDPAVSASSSADRSALVVLGRVSGSRDMLAPDASESERFLTSPLEGEVGGASLPDCRPADRSARRLAGGGYGLRYEGCLTPHPPRPERRGDLPLKGGGQECVRPAGHGMLASAPHVRVLACTARRVAAPELVGLIDVFDREWNPSMILFETNGAFRGIRDLLARHAHFGPKLKGVTHSADKAARVAALSVVVENGYFRLRGDARLRPGPHKDQRELWEEMVTFPYADRDDLVDAAAMGAAYLLNRREPRVW